VPPFSLSSGTVLARSGPPPTHTLPPPLKPLSPSRYNKDRDDFGTKEEFDDYLEEVEDIGEAAHVVRPHAYPRAYPALSLPHLGPDGRMGEWGNHGIRKQWARTGFDEQRGWSAHWGQRARRAQNEWEGKGAEGAAVRGAVK
jgi:hypothetical protein